MQPLLARFRSVLGGHLWTIVPELRHRVRPVPTPPTDPWDSELDDPRIGPVRLRGRLHHAHGANTLLVVVHGLGGTPDSPYCRRIANRAKMTRGWSSLRLALRGSTGDGEDLYHAAIGSDLAHALAHATLARYERILVVGYSLGGHIALTHGLDPSGRVLAIAAISSPLDLLRSCTAIDRRQAFVYRHNVLGGLKDLYRQVAARRSLSTPVEEIEAITTLRQWDRLAVVPRFGFEDVDDYYRRASVGPRLAELGCPALYVGMRHDPMIPPSTVDPSLRGSSPRLEVRWLEEGGHVGAPGTWEDDVLDWLDRQR